MNKKIKKIANTAYLIGFMLINQNNYFFNDIKSVENNNKAQIELKKTQNKEQPRLQLLMTRNEQMKLMNNVLKNNTHTGIDSVIKFVPENFLNKYLKIIPENIKKKQNIGYNRLETLTKTGEEVAEDRFKTSNNRRRALNAYASHLGIMPGSFGTQEEINIFLDLYKNDLITTAQKYNLNPSLLAAISIHESRGRTYTASNTGALGAFGLTKYLYNPQNTWPDGKNREPINPFNTLKSMDRAADFLSFLIKNYSKYDDANHTLTLTAYNQGELEINKTLRATKKENITNPLEIISYGDKIYIEEIDKIRNTIEKRLQKNYYITQEGREYHGKILKTQRQIANFF